jgi:tubby-related protein 1
MSVCFLIHEQMTFVYLFMDCKALSVHPFHLDNIFMQPGPRDAPMKCFIVRNRTTQTYYLYIGLTDALTDDGKFLLAARKCRRTTCTEYLISLDMNDISKRTDSYVGKLRSNFLGTKFTIYDAHPPYAGDVISKGQSARVIGSNHLSPRIPAGNYPVSHISYELNVLGSRYATHFYSADFC